MLDFILNQPHYSHVNIPLKNVKTYLKKISNVNYQSPRHGSDINPLVLMQNLEATNMVL